MGGENAASHCEDKRFAIGCLIGAQIRQQIGPTQRHRVFHRSGQRALEVKPHFAQSALPRVRAMALHTELQQVGAELERTCLEAEDARSRRTCGKLVAHLRQIVGDAVDVGA